MSIRKFKWREGVSVKGLKPENAWKELRRIEAKAGGLTPGAVVEAATSTKSPLHAFFQWDDTEAAKQYRLQQARQLIASVEVVYEESPQSGPVRAFVNVQSEKKHRYMSTDDAMTVPDVRRQILARALAEASAWQRRYMAIKELSGVFAALDDVKNGAESAA